MNCADVEKRLDMWVDEELEDADAVEVAGHLERCARCREARDELQAARRLFRDAMQPERSDGGAVARVRSTLRLGEGRPRRRWMWPALVAGPVVAVIAFWLLAPVIGVPDPSGVFEPAEKYVYHINSSANARTALQNIRFHLEASPSARYVVVTHNEGVDFLLKGASDDRGKPFDARVAELAASGVQFRVCGNTLRVRGIPTDRVVREATVVPSGIAEVGRLQTREHYAYLKP
jgi:intracellular sulfur oxidation DsrE/DsrF family protein